MSLDINYVSSGDFQGKEITLSLGQLMIMKGTFSSLKISKDTVESIKLLSVELSKNKEKEYAISIKFKTQEKCSILVNYDVYQKILSLFPQICDKRLEDLLKEGWKIINYSTSFLGDGMTSGIVKATLGLTEKHYFLLQKESKIRNYSVIVNNKGEEIGTTETIFN